MMQTTQDSNTDPETVAGFGDEWERFDQTALPAEEHERLFQGYFSVFPWEILPKDAQGFDLGCGSGRWALKVADRVGTLHCIDPSSAIEIARHNLKSKLNCYFHMSDVDNIPLEENSMDFGYSLGVLHHIPDTSKAMEKCVLKLKIGAPFLVYLYYSFENRPKWFQILWKFSEMGRAVISKLPHAVRYFVSQIIAFTVYWPLARSAALLERIGFTVTNLPLSSYRSGSFYTMRTDALDRFGTRLEQRFSRAQIKAMMEQCGLEDIRFSSNEPYWVAVGVRGASVGKNP